MMAETAASASYRPHVLLAENDECTLRVVQMLLQKCGYKGTKLMFGDKYGLPLSFYYKGGCLTLVPCLLVSFDKSMSPQ